MYSIFSNPDKLINGMSKNQLQRLYNLIDSYFSNIDKNGLEYRDGQVYMANCLLDVIESHEHLVIEAGVGIGKSYAYLIPLLYYHTITGKPFIISTSTIALQEQLENDIKKLSNELHLDIDVVVAKGMSNFLCLNKVKDEEYSIDKQDRKDYPNISDQEWNKLCVDGCLYKICRNYTKCEFIKRRKKMNSTNGVIITNHDLLITDLDKRNNNRRPLLNNSLYIVCDEAHNLENKVRSYYTKEIRIDSNNHVLSMIINKLNQKQIYDFNYNKIINDLNKLKSLINNNVDKKIKELRDSGIDIVDSNGIGIEFNNEIIKLSNKIYDTLVDLRDMIDIVSEFDEDFYEEKLDDKIDMIKLLKDANNGDYVLWVERKNNKNYIYSAPKNIDKLSNKIFLNNNGVTYNYDPAFIFTSATLSTKKDDYSYFLDGIGIKESDNVVIEESQDSPYNYHDNAIVYACDDIESPSLNKEKYLEQLVSKIKELILLTNGKTLVLFTSKSDMNYVYSKIGNKLEDINIYIQKDGSSQDEIKEKFKSDINSVLFSTGAFWEGIDIKGKSLSNVIIARLPFPIVDPIMEYKSSVYGNDGFKKVYLPEMLMKLKQGVGRLIRSKSDTGILCVLDSRFNKKYQEEVIETIPIKNITSNIDDVKKLVKKYNIDE